MKEVFVVHGGDSFATYEEYLTDLRGWSVSLKDGQFRGWKGKLMDELGDTYNVTQPRFPNAQNAKYEEWKLMFEKYLPLLPEETIFIGHSLGGSFLATYLNKEKLPFDASATVLIAPPFSVDGERALVEFSPGDSLELFKKQGGEIHLFHSEDDAVVPFAELDKYKAALPEAVPHVFKDRGHFNQEDFPELVECIRSL